MIGEDSRRLKTIFRIVSSDAPYDREGKIYMQKIFVAALVVTAAVILTGCGIPDLPGPIGIPGI